LVTGLVYGAEADIVDGEEDVVVEDGDVRTGDSVVTDEDLEAVKSLKPHSDADTYFLITKPTGLGNQLPAGKDVSFLVGFTNNGKTNFVVESMEASFRYAMDFSFHLQNFSAIAYNRLVKPNEQATFAYSFFVSEAYSTRPYGFTVNLNYKDAVSCCRRVFIISNPFSLHLLYMFFTGRKSVLESCLQRNCLNH